MKNCVIALVLTSFLVALPGCSGTSTVSPSVPGNIAPTTIPITGISSQGGPTIALPIPSQGSAAGIVSQVVPTPNMVVQSQAASANIAYPAIGNYYSNQPQNTGIWVTGQGQVSVIPDVASLTLGVSSQASTVVGAENNASDAMNAVIQVLKNKGVADNDITTVGFSINPVWNYKNDIVTGYQVSNMVTAKIRKISDVGYIIDSVTNVGGNLIRINGINFTVDEPSPFLKQAREKAMTDANSKASQLGSLSGIKLGPPNYITESTSNYAPVSIYYSAAASTPATTTSINPGETQISATVQVVYTIQ